MRTQGQEIDAAPAAGTDTCLVTVPGEHVSGKMRPNVLNSEQKTSMSGASQTQTALVIAGRFWNRETVATCLKSLRMAQKSRAIRTNFEAFAPRRIGASDFDPWRVGSRARQSQFRKRVISRDDPPENSIMV
jgi:hypothetical protein